MIAALEHTKRCVIITFYFNVTWVHQLWRVLHLHHKNHWADYGSVCHDPLQSERTTASFLTAILPVVVPSPKIHLSLLFTLTFSFHLLLSAVSAPPSVITHNPEVIKLRTQTRRGVINNQLLVILNCWHGETQHQDFLNKHSLSSTSDFLKIVSVAHDGLESFPFFFL